MIFWKTIPVKIFVKIEHVRKVGGKTYRSFIPDYGDVPSARFNEITQKWEEVVNPRGNAYAARKRLSYRK